MDLRSGSGRPLRITCVLVCVAPDNSIDDRSGREPWISPGTSVTDLPSYQPPGSNSSTRGLAKHEDVALLTETMQLIGPHGDADFSDVRLAQQVHVGA